MWFFGLDKESRAKKEIEEIRLHYVDVGKYQFEKEWLEFWPYRYSEYVKDEETFKKAVKNNEINGAMLYTMHENLVNAVKKCTLDLSRRHFEDRLRQVDRPLNQMREKAQNFCNEYYKDYKLNIKQRKAVLQEAKIYGDFLATLYPEKSTAEKTKNLINTELELYDFYENNNHIFSKKEITSFKHLTANFVNNVAKFSDYLAKIDKNNMLCVFCCNKCKAVISACVEYFKNDFEEIEKQLNSITNKNQSN